MLHQDGSKHQWVPGAWWDLVVTMDDATGEVYAGTFVTGEGTWSSFRGVWEAVAAKGLFDSLYTDRGSHYWHTPEAGGKVDKGQPDPVRAGDGGAGDRDDRRVLAAGAGPQRAAVRDAPGAPAAGAGAGGDHRDGCGERVPEGLLATLQRGVHGRAEGAGERILAPGAVDEGDASRHPLPEGRSGRPATTTASHTRAGRCRFRRSPTGATTCGPG